LLVLQRTRKINETACLRARLGNGGARLRNGRDAGGTRVLIAALAFLLCGLAHKGMAQQTAPDNDAAKEVWSDLAGTAGLQTLAPAAGETDEFPDFTRELVQIQWRAGDPIHLFVILPKGEKNPPPVVLYLYSFPSETDRFLNEDFCRLMTKGGYAAVGFVSALTGHRYHDRAFKNWFISELPEALGSTVHDVRMILNYLSSRGDLDMTRVGMFGEGSGGTVAILSAAVDSRIQAIDLLDPWGDWPDWMAKSTLVPEEERPDYLKPEFLKQAAPFDPLQWFSRVKSAVRLQALTDPAATPKIARDRIAAAAPPQTQAVPVREALAEYKETKGAKFLDWIKNQLTLPLVNRLTTEDTKR
jgi:hypothetical protein